MASANPYYDIIEDAVLEALMERDALLPDEFEVMLEDDSFQAFIEAGLHYPDGKAVSLTAKRIQITIGSYRILVRSDKDPDQWAIVVWKDGLN